MLLTGLAGLLFVLSIFFLGTLLLSNNESSRQLFTQTVTVFSGYQCQIDGQFDLQIGKQSHLSLTDLQLQSNKKNRRIQLTALTLDVDFSHLLEGKLLINDLQLSHLKIIGSKKKHPIKPVTPDWLRYLPSMAIKQAKIDHINILQGDQQIFALEQLLITKKTASSPQTIYAQGKAFESVYIIEGNIGNKKLQSHPVNITATWRGSKLHIDGILLKNKNTYAVNLAINLEPVTLRSLFPNMPNLAGHIQGKAQLHGQQFNKLQLSKIHLQITDKERWHCNITGIIGNLLSQKETQLKISSQIFDSTLLNNYLPAYLPQADTWHFNADLTKPSQYFHLSAINLKLVTKSGLNFLLTGESDLQNSNPPFHNSRLKAELKAPSTAATGPYASQFLPELGTVSAQATISNVANSLFFENLHLQFGSNQQKQLLAEGRFALRQLHTEAFSYDSQLHLTLNVRQAKDILQQYAIRHDPNGTLHAEADVLFNPEQLLLNNIHAQINNRSNIKTSLTGMLQWDSSQAFVLQKADFIASVESPSNSDFFRLYDIEQAYIGPLDISFHLAGQDNRFFVDQLNFRIGTPQTLLIQGHGTVQDIFPKTWTLRGLQLHTSLNSSSSKSITSLFGQNSLPEFGAVTASAKLNGTLKSFAITDLQFQAGTKNTLLQLQGAGEIERIQSQRKIDIQGMDIDFDLSIPSPARLKEWLPLPIASEGTLHAYGKLRNNKHDLLIAPLTLKTANKTQVSQSSIRVNHALSNKPLKVQVDFSSQLLTQITPLKTLKNNQALRGKLIMQQQNHHSAIHEFSLYKQSTELLQIKAQANNDNIYATEVKINNLEHFNAFLDSPLPKTTPIHLNGLTTSNEKQLNFSGAIKSTHNQINTNLTLNTAYNRPKISGSLQSDELSLADFGFAKRASSNNRNSQKRQLSKKALPLSWLNAVDLDIDTKIARVKNTEQRIEDIAFALHVENGQLTVKPAKFKVNDGVVTFDFAMHAKQKQQTSLSLTAQNIPLANFFAISAKQKTMPGYLDLLLKLDSKGNTPQQLAKNLNGSMKMAVENILLQQRKLEVLFFNLIGFLFTYGITDNELHIQCGLFDFSLINGKADSQLFLIDGPKIIVFGDGTVDLGKENIDFIISLEKKKLLVNNKVPIFIKGNLYAPDISQAPLDSIVKQFDRYLLAPVIEAPTEVIGTFLSVFNNKNSQNSHCAEHLSKK